MEALRSFTGLMLGVGLCAVAATSRGAEPYQEYSKRIEAAQTLTALKSELMGDSVSVYNGATDFSVTDIELAGSGMPVRLTRRLSVELTPIGCSAASAWPKPVARTCTTF